MMSKKIILTLLVMGMTLSSFGAFAEDVADPIPETTIEQTADGTDVDEEPALDTQEDEISDETVDEPSEEAVDEIKAEDSKNGKKPDKKEDVKKDETDSTTKDEPAVDENNDKTGKSKVIKDVLKERKEALAQAKVLTKDYIKEIKGLFKDADVATRKEILGEIAAIKKELKDLSIGTFVKGLVVDYEKYDGVKPVIEMGRTLVPVRAITETLGATVEWIEDTKTIIITKDENKITMQLDNKTANVNGTDVELEVAPTTKNDRTLVPIRFIAESLKLTVDWDEDSQTIVVD